MKIKKVEISGFRAYDDPRFATFNFESSFGLIADFVSIYAPNGFGKTSFYDAVEWAMTNDLSRYSRQGSEFNTYVRDNKQIKFEFDSQKTPFLFLRNKNSPTDRASYVKIDFDLPEYDVKKDVPVTKRKDSDDAVLSKENNQEFKQVILSQESIDAFLKEEKPEDRYSKFAALFGYESYDRAYNNLIYLIAANDARIKGLKGDLSKLQPELNFGGDLEILNKINEFIQKLNEKGESFPLINSTFTETDFIGVSNLITTRKLQIRFRVDLDSKDQSDIRTLLTGTEKIPSMDDYFHVKTNINGIREKLKQTDLSLALFSTKNHLSNAIIAKRIEQAALETEQTKIEKYATALPEYIVKIDQCAQLSNEISTLSTNILNVSAEIEITKNRISQAEKREGDVIKKQLEIQASISNLPSVQLRLSILQAEMSSIEVKIESLDKEIATSEGDLEKRSKLLSTIQSYIEAINAGTFDFTPIDEVDIGSHLHSALELKRNVEKAEHSLRNAEADIREIRGLNVKIIALIDAGRQIIESSKANECPLCNTSFDNYDDLIRQILTNPGLSKIEKNLLDNRSIAETSLSSAKIELEVIVKKILQHLADIQAKSSIGEIQVTLDLKRKDKTTDLVRKTEIEKELLEISASLLGNQPETQLANLAKEEELIGKELRSLQDELKEQRASLQKQQTTEGQLKNTKVIREGELKTISNAEAILLIERSDFKNIAKGDISEKIRLRNDELVIKIQQVNLDIEELMKRLADVEESCTTLVEVDLLEEKKKDELLLSQELARTKSFEMYFQEILKASMPDDRLQAEEVINGELQIKSVEIEKSMFLLEHFQVIEGLKENVLLFIKFNISKTTADEIAKRIYYCEETVGRKLESEKRKLADFIQTQVESFFFEDTINSIYSKLDPHPDYKKIKFKCIFPSDGKPRLHVFVDNDLDNDLKIPNLYFSTAQINILSLSIFLANALNAKTSSGEVIECIFIDDPIQSMDSINILSAIDLFRSLVVNYNKQIILSTHDENFHNLLQKKIPSELFPSKFIELETFGKIKTEQ